MPTLDPPEKRPELWEEQPDAATQRRLRDLIFKSLKERGEQETTYRGLLKVLFERSIHAADQDPPARMADLPVATLAQELGRESTAVSQTRSRLNDKLDELFGNGTCCGEDYRIRITSNKFALRFARNPKPSVDFVSAFWMPYIKDRTATIYYPEPQFFKDKRDTYYRNHAVNDDDAEAARAVLDRQGTLGELEPSQSFIPSGFVVALVRLFEHFSHTGQLQLSAHRLRWADAIHDVKTNVVILGTSSSVKAISMVTDVFPMQSVRAVDGRNAVTVRGAARPYRDQNHTPEQDTGALLDKWVVVTRRRQDDRYITVFSGHSRAVEAAIKIVTGARIDNFQLSEIASAFGNAYRFDGEFQILLGTKMSWSKGDLKVRHVAVEAVYDGHSITKVPSSMSPTADGAQSRPVLPAKVERSKARLTRN